MIEFSELKEMPKALCKLQSESRNPTRNKKAYNYFYADMDEVLDCIKKPCADNGFSVVQMPYNQDDIVGVETMLLHESGEFIKAKFGSRLAKVDPQSLGSQISYYRRYSILALFNLSQEDDDGASVSNKSKPQQQPQQQSQKNNAMASDSQKKCLFAVMGKDEYNKHKEYLEKKMTKEQADKKIKELKGE